jgi:hypothetical protein
MNQPASNPETKKQTPPQLLLEIGKRHATALACLLLQNGFILPNIKVGCSVREFLAGELGLTPEYIRNRIQSLFLDGKPVDDYDVAHIRNGSRLALSSALPGLVGATLRQGGLLAAFRGSITYRDSGINETGSGTVHVKLFNLIMDELGPSFLLEGILVKTAVLQSFIQAESGLLWNCTKILFNDEPIKVPVLLANDFFDGYDLIKLSIRYSTEEG